MFHAHAQQAQSQALPAVILGHVVCADKVLVTVAHVKDKAGHYSIQLGKHHYQVQQVQTESGAVRLEDKKHGIVWLQVANKSMLLNEKQSKRIATDCRNREQQAAQLELDRAQAQQEGQ